MLVRVRGGDGLQSCITRSAPQGLAQELAAAVTAIRRPAYQARQNACGRWGGCKNPPLADKLSVTAGCSGRQSQLSSGLWPF